MLYGSKQRLNEALDKQARRVKRYFDLAEGDIVRGSQFEASNLTVAHRVEWAERRDERRVAGISLASV